MSDVAEAVGVSRMTVSYAFRGGNGVSAETRARVLEAARRLGYRRDVIASQLASHRTNTIALSLLDLRFEINAEILYGLQHAAHQDGRRVFLAAGEMPASTDQSHEIERETIASLLDMRADALVLAGSLLPDSMLREYAAQIPLVLVTRRTAGVNSIAVDDAQGAATATEHLLDLGHRNIAHIATPTWYPYTARRDGYVSAMTAAGLVPRIAATEFDQASAAGAAGQLLDSSDVPTAIFCHNDVAALGVRDACAARGLRVPEDLSLVGFDDTHAAALPGIDLTTVTQQARHMGELAARRISNIVADPSLPVEHSVLQPQLMVRASTAALG